MRVEWAFPQGRMISYADECRSGQTDANHSSSILAFAASDITIWRVLGGTETQHERLR